MYPLLSFYLKRLIRKGTLTIHTVDGGHHSFGDGEPPHVELAIKTRAAERQIGHNPALKLGECYMDGEVDMVLGSIYDLIALVFDNAAMTATGQPWMKAIEQVRLLYRRVVQNNVPKRSRRNVQRHYDLSGDLYALFLDPDWQYSCAYFETPEQSLADAQLAKKRHIAAKLRFDRPGLSTLDIGSGWGGMGLYLARECGARVKGVTLSDEQLKRSNTRAVESGLSDRVRFELQDYRHIEERFDRIVSVGMFEHVGRDFYDPFFQQAAKLLKPDGVMLLHTIGRTTPPYNTNSFIDRHIFPGGYIPSLSEVMPAIECSGLGITDIEVLRLHYAETCRAWRMAFLERWSEAEALYDRRFCRMWEFYLAISEASFRWQGYVVFQIQLTHAVDALPIRRDYMTETEKALKQREARAVEQPERACVAAE
ncbi:cyclopropane-fatty-acyl-phospholipid synthase family protein [Aureimonas sp. AU4]|uniref:class I SAM-dependent methyltransferase n=1 Tax=Aureimonas sp. AU4 TaxID=1638163 RepID=UPI000783E3EA